MQAFSTVCVPFVLESKVVEGLQVASSLVEVSCIGRRGEKAGEGDGRARGRGKGKEEGGKGRGMGRTREEEEEEEEGKRKKGIVGLRLYVSSTTRLGQLSGKVLVSF